ncbi:hypothetical protein [Shewanella sp. MEBiC00475]|nr:hypothetical protein [Shewanella sp. MEBiC00475]
MRYQVLIISGIHLEYGLLGVWAALVLDEWIRGFSMIWRWRICRW